MKSFDKISKITESAFLFIALLGIMLITGAGVMSLNPKIRLRSPEVAGVSTSLNSTDFVLDINNETNGFIIYENEDMLIVRINQLLPGQNEFSLGSIQSLNSKNDENININLLINGNVQNEIQVEMFDSITDYNLYSNTQNVIPVNLILEPLEVRPLSLKVNSVEKINFPIELILEIK